MTKRVAVVGSGIAGITAAYYLAKEGYNITVYDKENYPAMQCSYANGGQVSVSNSETWTTWANVAKGLKWMTKKDAPLLIRPNLEWDKIKWLAKFLYHTANGDYTFNTSLTIRSGLKARQLYNQIQKDEKIEFNRVDKGILHVYSNEEYFNQAKISKNIYESNGCEWQILEDKEEIFAIDPALKNMNNIVGAAFTPSDFTGDIHKFCTNMYHILKNKYGVRFIFGIDIAYEDLDIFDIVVIANGSGVRHLSKEIGDNLPVYPVKGYSITIPAIDVKSFEAMPKVSLLDDEAKIVTSFLGDRLRIAGTAELAGDNWDIRKDRIQPLLKWVWKNFPNINTSDYKSWACLRPMTPNMMPIVNQSSKDPRVYYHAGHGHLGWTLAPATAKLLVEIIKGN